MIDMKFRLAYEDDLDRVEAIFKGAINEMRRNDIDQWDSLYPDRSIIEEDIMKKQLYISLSEGNIVSAYVINRECDEKYSDGNWKYADSSYSVIHRLCVNPKYQNQGIGKLTIQYIERELKNKGIETVRLDVFSLNPYALKMYEKSGYSKTGEVYWRKGKFYLMEKKI